MGATGPGQVRSLNFNAGAPTVTVPFVVNYGIANEPGTYESAYGISVERGSILKRVTADILDYSAFATINTLMTGRTEHDLIITYADGSTQTLQDGLVRIRPISNVVPDVKKVLIAATGTALTALDAGTGYTDLGRILENPSVTYDFPFDGNEGAGRPYYSAARINGTVMLPAATYASLDSFVNTECIIAFQLPDGNWQVHDNVWVYRHYGDEDATQPRIIRLRFTGVEDTWAELLQYHDGSLAASTPGDMFAGGSVEWVGHHYTETSLTAWA